MMICRFFLPAILLSGWVFTSPCLCCAQDSESGFRSSPICEYPRVDARQPFAALDPGKLSSENEIEPNGDVASAQVVPLGFADGLDQDVDIGGEITIFDNDLYRFSAKQGETLGLATLAIDNRRLNSLVAVLDKSGSVLIENDDHGGLAGLYPPESEFPAGGLRGDSALTFAVPSDGTYFVRVKGLGASQGQYQLQMRLRRPPTGALPKGSVQTVFLDFDGAVGIDAASLFGDGGRPSADLARFADFLPRWGIAANREPALVQNITDLVRQHFANLTAGTGSEINIVNSQEVSDDPFGDPLVSRVIVGGTRFELGISTIGIAEHIDPATYSTDDTAVVLLDLLSAPSTDPGFANSILSLQRNQGTSVEDAVARIVAAVVCHEMCHYLGCWHTENSNAVVSIIDRGGRLRNLAGVGPDGILGTADDAALGIHDDTYALENVAHSTHVQNVRARVIASLTAGTVEANQQADGRDQLTATIKAFRTLQADPNEHLLGLTVNEVRKLIGIPTFTGPTAGSSGNAKRSSSRSRSAIEALEKRRRVYDK